VQYCAIFVIVLREEIQNDIKNKIFVIHNKNILYRKRSKINFKKLGKKNLNCLRQMKI